MATTVTTKGQVTIPKEVRDLLGIKPGSAVAFEVAEDGRVVLSKVGRRGPTTRRPPSRFAKLRGRASAGMTTEEIMALTRGEE
jgi:AbrB family looped-hinge helix DNA binding protein